MVEINCSEKRSFIHYSSGVYTNSGGRTVHAVAIVGYGNVNGTDTWIVRNSWSDQWGDKVSLVGLVFFFRLVEAFFFLQLSFKLLKKGYILMKRGTNTCGIADMVICPII